MKKVSLFLPDLPVQIMTPTKSASHVLQAIGKNQFEARGSVRISLGRFNNQEDVADFMKIFVNEVHSLKSIFSK